MKPIPPNQFRLTHADVAKRRLSSTLGSSDDDGMNGCFFVPRSGVILRCYVSDGATDGAPEAMGWEHVSVSLGNRCPTWEEMSFIKDVFWNVDETVMQLHPPKSHYVNLHPFCLHLWRHHSTPIPVPSSILVGIKS